jgi:hypothetical protein
MCEGCLTGVLERQDCTELANHLTRGGVRRLIPFPASNTLTAGTHVNVCRP